MHKLTVNPTSGAIAHHAAYQTHIQSLAEQIKPRVLVAMRGSGNYGEQSSSAFYTIDKLPPALVDWESAPSGGGLLERTDIDLGPNRLAFYVDDVLTHGQADALAACAESILKSNGHSRVAPGINTPPGMRVNMAAHWYPAYDAAPAFLGPIFQRIRHLVPPTLGGLPLYDKLNEKVAHFRYDDGDRFTQHVDGLFPGSSANVSGDGTETWTGVQSGLSMLLFLNDLPTDGLVGGETRLWSEDGSRQVDVTPRKGRALFFRRGSADAVLHAGMPVSGQVPKYMALINVLYGERLGTEPAR